VAVIEDNRFLLAALKAEIQFSEGLRCIGAFDNCEDFLKALPRLRPDVVLMDLGLPGMDGINCTIQLKRRWPRAKVLIFSTHETREKIVKSLTAGADGYLVKSTPRQKLAQAIHRVHNGESVISEQVAHELVGYLNARPDLIQNLSPQEQRILEEFDRGGTYKEIAQRLGISPNTLKEHAKRIRNKTGVDSMAAAAYIRKSVI
jgi:DNA-binding NarL/FixJ family response regulator